MTDERTDCKSAKFLTTPIGMGRTKSLLMIFAKLPLSLRLRGMNVVVLSYKFKN